MICRTLFLLVVGLVAVVLFYMSRFWNFQLWTNDGLFGIRMLRPQGGLLAQWLRGTPFEPYELLIWAVGSVLILTRLQNLLDRLQPKKR